MFQLILLCTKGHHDCLSYRCLRYSERCTDPLSLLIMHWTFWCGLIWHNVTLSLISEPSSNSPHVVNVYVLFMVISIPPLDGAVAGSYDREVSLVLESSTTVPLHHRLTLQFLLTHLSKVTQAQASNGLDTHTLGQIFGPLLIRTGPSTLW